MVQKFDRPTLTTDEKAILSGVKDPLKVAREVLQDLASIGVPVEEEMATVEQAEQTRDGLTRLFSTQRPRRA